MWKQILWFELRYQFRQPLLALSAVLFFALAVGLGSSEVGVAIGDAPGTTMRNAPIAVARLMPVISLLGLFVITAFVASAALRDFEHRSQMLFFTKPLQKIDFLAGRFGGSMAASLVVMLAAVAGLVVANFVPWQTPDRLGPVVPAAYLFGLLVVVIPNLLVMGALFFALATWSRRLTVTFLGVVFFIGMQDAVEILAQGLESRVLGSLLEPSGIVALDTAARYWTLAEQNSRLPELVGVLLANRLIWLGLAAVVLAVSWWRFDFTAAKRRPRKGGWLARKRPEAEPSGGEQETERFGSVALPKVRRGASAPGCWRQLLGQTRLEISEVLSRAPFLTLVAFGLLFVVAYAWGAGSYDGMPSYPLTHLMLGAIQLGVRLTLVLILVLYAGELVFSQRQLGLSQVYDALPVPNWVFLVAKVLALMAIVAVFALVGAATTIAVQLIKGFPRLELDLYFKGLVVLAWPMLPLLALAVIFQVLAGRKLLGMLLTVGALVVRFALPRLGFQDHLYLYGTHPAVTYTDLNGYGHHAAPFLGFMAYWSACGMLLLLAALVLWPRGVETSIRRRLALARGRLSRPVAMVGILGLLVTTGLGAWLWLQARSAGGYFDRDRVIDRLVDFEHSYHPYRDAVLPRVTSVFAEVDIFAVERQVEIRGRYRLENRSTQPIRVLPITLSPRWVEGVLRVYGGVTLVDLELPEHVQQVADPELGFYVVELAQALPAGEGLDLGFTVRVDHRGFGNSRHNDLVIEDGTFFSNRNFLPVIGYARSNELRDPIERSRRGLSELAGSALVGNLEARQRNYLEADWIDFEAILSTDAGQVAIAPGDLLRRWGDGGRDYFHYRTTAPITNLIPFLSGNFEVRKERWNEVELEVYFHSGHAFNIDRFVEVTKTSLNYLTESLGPYPHGQLRIVEVPNYHGQVAFSFAQTIAFSESWAFTADLENAELDWLTAILAHEIAHQWWNHQVVPGDVQGATMIAESLPQYAAMMILERIYGEQAVRRFLDFHLDRYLERRGNERRREQPLALVENQAYIHYSKASLALYNLADQVGEQVVNGALHALVGEYAFQGPPYPTTGDLLAQLRAVLPEERHQLLEDLFETVTIFDNRVTRATYHERPDGKFVVELETASIKVRDDGRGGELEVVLDDWVDLGVFGEQRLDGKVEETVLAMESRHLQQTTGRFTFVVDSRPVRAGIDPYTKLIDRDSGDNVRTLTQVSPGNVGD